MIILDASAAVEILSNSIEGRSFLSLMAPKETCVAPDLYRFELANSMRKMVVRREISRNQAVQRFEAGLDLIDVLWASEELFPEVLTESLRLNHPPYDLAYLVLARRFNATLFSRDKRLNELCDECGVMRIHDVEF